MKFRNPMTPWIECVPNFSDGRNPFIVNAIASEIEQTSGVVLLDVDPGKDANRTVITFTGQPENVMKAAFRSASRAAELIDMTCQHGEHMRMGAMDVCPFVPLSGVSMNDCADLARQLGQQIGNDLGIPVYLYGEAASLPERKNLAYIRSGQYEGLKKKLKQADGKPDFGPSKFNARSGASAVGARDFLIAFNINLDTKDIRTARAIAAAIRESGKIVVNKHGKKVHKPGLFKACRAIGWMMASHGCAQVSTNLTDFRLTPPHVVYEACARLASSFGTRITGSELVGLIPLEAVLATGRHYLESKNATEEELVRAAVKSLGLDSLRPFDPDKKILEYRLRHLIPNWPDG